MVRVGVAFAARIARKGIRREAGRGRNMTGIAFPTADPRILARRDAIIEGLARLVPPEALITSEDERRPYETDAFTAYRRLPLAVVLPGTTAEVSAVLRFCSEQGVPVVPRGAGTSLAGGAIPQEDAVVIGVSRMNRILELDYANRTARVEAGVTNLAITGAVMHEGFFYAPDPSSQLACTIAGNIAMNSGGAHCLKYGVTTNNVLGVTMVLLDGSVVEIGGKHLDSEGYDLLGLVTGSEGQIGIVTEATVRILRAAEGARPVLFGFPSSVEAGAAVAAIIASGILPVAMEFMDKPAIDICESFAHAGYPMDVEALLIIEVEGSQDEMDRQLKAIIEIAKRHGVKNVKESQSAMEAAAIWKGRKSAFGATGRIADYICMDGTIPTGQLPLVLRRIDEIVKGYGLRVANVFHAGDGNLHPLVLYNCNDPEEARKAEDAGNDILKLCVEVGGCLTGEHGVGIEKRDLMNVQFAAVDLNQQMAIRAVFDPSWLMNPAKVFPLEGRIAA
jgi:glycolate oxidase